MLEEAAFLLLRVASAAVCAWVLWVLFWMALDVVAVARATASSAKLGFAWSKAVAVVTASHPDADARNARVSVAFDLPSGGSAAATVPALHPVLWAGGAKGPQVFPRTMGRGLLPAIADRPVGSKLAVVYDPADPRRVEQGMGVARGAVALASAASLAIVAPFGLGMVAALLEYVVSR